MREHFESDLLVVGGGPAGCSAAIFAAGQGLRVLLVDKERFPRDKVCGDGITPAAQVVLERMGALEAVESCALWRTRRLVIHSPQGTIFDAPVPKNSGMPESSIIMPRAQFDRVLLEQAKATPRVEVLEGCEVEHLWSENGRVCGCEAKRDDTPLALRAPWVIAADGAHSKIAKELALNNTVPKHRALALRAYFEDVEGLEDGAEFHYYPEIMPAYAWVFPTGERTANVGLGIPCEEESKKDIKRLFEKFVADNPNATRKLRHAKRVEKSLRACPLPLGSYRAARSRGNVLLTGDAGSFVDPLSGEGIFQALRTGELAVQSIKEAGNQPDTASSRYEKLWRREFLWTDFMPGYLVQRVISHPRILELFSQQNAKSLRRATVLGGAISHVFPKRRLLFNF